MSKLIYWLRGMASASQAVGKSGGLAAECADHLDALTAMVKRLTASGEDLRAHLNVAAWPASAQVQVVLDEAAAAQSEARALIGEDGK